MSHRGYVDRSYRSPTGFPYKCRLCDERFEDLSENFYLHQMKVHGVIDLQHIRTQRLIREAEKLVEKLKEIK